MTKELLQINPKWIPSTIFNRFKCDRCLERGDCDYIKLNHKMPEMEICSKKIGEVVSHLPPYRHKPSFEQINLDLSKAFNRDMEIEEINKIKKLEKKLEEIEDPEEIQRVETKINEAKARYSIWSKRAMEYDDRAVDRQTEKKVTITKKTAPSFEELSEWIHPEKVVDVKGVVKDETT